MTPLFLETHGFAPHGRRRRIDFTRLKHGDKVALVGSNGNGKSMIGFSFGAAFYGVVEGYAGGTHVKDCRAEGVETLLVQLWFRQPDGQIYRIKRQVDKRGHAVYLHRLEGFAEPLRFLRTGAVVEVIGASYKELPEQSAGLVGDLADELERIGILDYDLWMSAGHAHQKGIGDFFAITGSGSAAVDERRKLLASMLGARRTQRLSTKAGEHRKLLGKVIDRIAEELDRLEAKAADVEQLTTALTVRRIEVDKATRAIDPMSIIVAKATERLEGLQARVGTATTALSQVDHSIRTRSAEVDRHRRRIREVDQDIHRASELGRELASLQASHAQAEELAARIRTLTTSYRAASAERTREEDRLQNLRRRLGQLERPPLNLGVIREELEDETALLQAKVARQPQLLEQRQGIIEERAPFEVTEREIAGVDQRAREHSTKITALVRTAQLRESVPCGGAVIANPDGGDDIDCATCQFLADAVEAEAALPAAQAQLKTIEAQAQRMRENLATFRRYTTSLEAVDQELGALQADIRRLDNIRVILARYEVQEASLAEIAQLEGQIAAAVEQSTQLREQLLQLTQDGKSATEALRALGDGRPAEAVVAQLRDQLDEALTADARVETLRGEHRHLAEAEAAGAEELRDLALQRQPLATALATLEDELGQVRRDLSDATMALENARLHLGNVRTEEAKVAGRLEALQAELSDLPGLRLAHTDAGRERADWRMIEEGMSIKGVQGLMVDLAGPTFTDYMNALLATMYDPADVPDVIFSTFDPTAKGAKRETAEILIKYPGDASHRQLRVSPGQQQPLTIAMRGAALKTIEREHGVHLDFTIADELENHLDPERRRRYLETLDATGTRTWLIVTHHEEIVSQCQHCLRIDDALEDGCEWER